MRTQHCTVSDASHGTQAASTIPPQQLVVSDQELRSCFLFLRPLDALLFEGLTQRQFSIGMHKSQFKLFYIIDYVV
jgi:hypothetical protein